MNRRYITNLIEVIKEKEKESMNVNQIARLIEKRFGSPLYDGVIKYNGKTLTPTTIKTIKSLFGQQHNIYNSIVYLLQSHLNWLNIYCKETFDGQNSNSGTAINMKIKNDIRNKILTYMKRNHNLDIENCNENTRISDLITYDSSENIDDKLKTAYMFLSMFRITQSSKTEVDHTKNYCILLNEFMTNLEKLLVVNNKITKTTTKRVLFLPKTVNNNIKIKEDEYLSNLSDISSPGIRNYGVFILKYIINALFFPVSL